jgi:hypothetical protein
LASDALPVELKELRGVAAQICTEANALAIRP